MANLGTLWFGADIDLSALKQKIQNGNQSILDALKMNYDPQSYNQMVNKLRTELGKETFDIKIKTNAAAVRQNLQNSLSSINNSANAPKLDLSGLKGIPGMKMQMAQLTESIVLQTEKVRALKREWQNMVSAHGKESAQAKAAFSSYRSAVDSLNMLRTNAGLLGVDMRRASIAAQENAKQMRDAAKSARQWNSDHLRLNATLAGGIHISTQLGSALSSLFALDAARQFLGQVIEIGGQLEKQRISIGAILGDTVKASHLFEQIKGLALQSPFGVVELDQYTKQLSAYGFKYNELFDMTKRLADISAGAGTDIGRLTLALGHVRSATYLTGITLRQFSMNNIPMLKMLADYYSEVEKHAVTTAEVQKRISKRQVSYEDVIEQIRRLTDEGGMFYNMQEKISESLAARYKNLRDAMDIMYGEMAEGMVGDALKSLASVLLKTTRHWREILSVMGVAMGAFMLSKLRIGAQTIAMQGNTAATLKNIMATKQLAANQLMAASTYRTLTAQERIAVASRNSLTAADLRQAMAVKSLSKSDVLRLIALKKINVAQAMHLAGINGITAAEIRAAAAAGKWRTALAGLQMSLKNAFMGVGAGTWATLAAMAGMEIYMAYDQWNSKIDDKSKEMKDLIKSRIIDMQKLQKTMGDGGKPTDNVELKNRVDEMKQVLANSEAYTKTLDEQLKKTEGLPEQYDILATAIENAVEKNRRMLDVQDDVAEMIKASTMGKGFFGNLLLGDAENPLAPFLNDDINKNMQQTLDAYKDLRTVIDTAWEYKEAIKNVIDEMVKSGQISEQFAEQLKKAPFEEQIQLLAESGYWQAIVDKISSTDLGFLQFADRIKDASNGITERWDEIVNDDIPRMMKKKAEDFGGDEKKMREWALNNVDDFKIMLEGIADQLGVQEPEIRRRLKRLFYDYVRFGELEKGLADGAAIGASLFDDDTLKKLLGEDEKADITDKADPAKKEDKGSKNDKDLEDAKTRLQQYKAFLSEYKKYRELYDKEKAVSKLGELFPNLKDEKGNFLGLQLVDNYTEVLDKLRKDLPATTEARKKFHNEINKTSADTVFDREKESIKKNAEAMDEYAKKMQDQWKLYRSLLSKSGGNHKFASLAFNDNGVLWDDISKKMLDTFNRRGQKLGVIPVGFRWDMNEQELKDTLVDANGQVQTELVNLAKKIQEIIKGNYNKFLEESAEAYSKALSNADKVTEVERQLAALEKERSEYNGNNSAVIAGYDAQIKAKRRELEQAKSDALKESNDYLNFYNAILTLTIPEAERIGQAIKENLNLELKAGRLSARQYLAEIKNINKQMNELRNKKSGLGAFLSGGLNGYIDNMKQQGDSQWQRGVNDLQASEKSFEKAVEIYNKASSAGDVKGMDAADAQMQASENAMASAKSMMASGEAMSNAAGEAGSTVAVIDKIIHGIDGVVQGMKGTFDEIREMYDALGHNTDTEEWNEWGTFFNSFSEASSNATKGWDSLKNGDIGGVIQGVVGSWTSWFTGISRGWDAKMDRRIKLAEEQLEATNRMREAMEMVFERTLGGVYDYKTTQESIDKLIEARDRTEEIDEKTYGERWRSSAKAGLAGSAIGGAIGMVAGPIGAAVGAVIGGVLGNIFGAKTRKFTVNYYSDDTIKKMDEAIKSQSYYDEQLALLFKQRDELQHQLAAEQDKKDIDNEKVEDYKTQIAEVKDQIDNFAQDLAKTLWDIDVRDWASQLGDALFEAWQKGENGAMAFKKKAAEIISDLAKNIATKKLVEVAMKPVLDAITSEMERTDGLLDATSMERISNSLSVVGNTLPSSFNTLLDSIEEGAKRAGLGTLKGSDTSSSASAGIKSITEQTADLLASYINAIRADVSVIRAEQSVHLPAIAAAIQRTSVLAETQVTHLQQIASNTQRNADAADRIYDIMHKIDIGVTKIKVA